MSCCLEAIQTSAALVLALGFSHYLKVLKEHFNIAVSVLSEVSVRAAVCNCDMLAIVFSANGTLIPAGAPRSTHTAYGEDPKR